MLRCLINLVQNNDPLEIIEYGKYGYYFQSGNAEKLSEQIDHIISNYSGEIMENSSTHHRISGGHFGSGTFGYFSNKKRIKNPPTSIIDFSDFVKGLFNEDSSIK